MARNGGGVVGLEGVTPKCKDVLHKRPPVVVHIGGVLVPLRESVN